MYRSNRWRQDVHSHPRAARRQSRACGSIPNNPKRLINGNDGGATISTDGGESWTSIYNQPTAQFYHVTSDNRFPYYIYGAQQDNSTVAIASAEPRWRHRSRGLVRRGRRRERLHRSRSDRSAISSTPARTAAKSRATIIAPAKRRRSIRGPSIRSAGRLADLKHRFQWTEPIVFSPHDPKTLYFAGEVLFKTTDAGMSWTIISPDLTRNDKSKQAASGGPITKDNTGVEVYDTIFSVVESPVAERPDLGRHRRRSGAHHARWRTALGQRHAQSNARVGHGQHDRGVANGRRHGLHRRRTPQDGRLRAIHLQDHRLRQDLDQAGERAFPQTTTCTPFASIRSARACSSPGPSTACTFRSTTARKWQPLQTQPAGLASERPGREEQRPGRRDARTQLLDPRRHHAAASVQRFDSAAGCSPVRARSRPATLLFEGSFFGGGGNVGKNPPAGADLLLAEDFAEESRTKKAGRQCRGPRLRQRADDTTQPAKATKKDAPKITLEILDSSGKVIRKFPKKEERGTNRTKTSSAGRSERRHAARGCRPESLRVGPCATRERRKVPKAPLWGGNTDGPEALPGNYQVRLTVLGQELHGAAGNQRRSAADHHAADLQKQFDLLMKIRDKVTLTDDTIIRFAIFAIRSTRSTSVWEMIRSAKAIVDAGKALDKKMTEVEEALIQTKAKSGQDVLNFPVRLNNHLVALSGVVGSAESAPTQQSYEVFDLLSKSIDEQLAKWKTIVASEVKSYNDVIKQQEVPALILKQPSGQ